MFLHLEVEIFDLMVVYLKKKFYPMKSFTPKSILFLLALILYNFQVFSQDPDCSQEYIFSTFEETYEDLDITQSISLTEGLVWYSPNLLFPIGFEFNFYGIPTSNLLVTSIFFGAGVVGNPNGFDSHNNFFLPAFCRIGDLALADFEQGSANGISDISYVTVGEEGNRILKLQWKNVGFAGALEEGITDSWMNYQLWLYEADQSIEFRYGSSQLSAEAESVVFSSASPAPSIALICSIPVSYGQVNGEALAGDPTDPSVVDYNLATGSPSGGIPESGRVYRWYSPDAVTVEETETVIELDIFPNPFENELSFSSNSIVESVQILNLTGKLVLESTMNCSACQISTKDLSSGIYLVKIKIGDQVISRKLTKA